MLIFSLIFKLFLFNSVTSLKSNEENIPGRLALDNFPLVDGHNDLPNNLFKKLNNSLEHFAFATNLTMDQIFGSKMCNSCHTDIPRMKEGKLGAQFWSAFVHCTGNEIISQTLDQIDVIKRLIFQYPNSLKFVTTADGILDAFNKKQVASLIGLEGGHSLNNKLSLLRQYYELGVRYMTLTHVCDLPWADCSLVDANAGTNLTGLTEFGKKIILEMNRLGMMVDLSHASYNVMNIAIDTSKAPVIFSHSSAFSVYPHHRNVRDDILLKVRTNQGIVMVNFYSKFIGKNNVTIRNVIDHINHIADIAGMDHVGIGSDFDGIESVPEGLEDVSKFPHLFDLLKELNPNKWTIENLEKLAGRNFHRVFKKVEAVKEEMLVYPPDESRIPEDELSKFNEYVKM